MFSFKQHQKEVEFSGIVFGGQPGKNPTVLFGGLFFKGVPDVKRARKYTEQMYEVSEKTGVPGIADVFFRKEEYVCDILDFVERYIPSELPFSVDITDATVKVKVLRELDERGLLARTIYNSVHVGLTEDEERALRDHTPGLCLALAFNPRDKSPDGRIEVLSTGAGLLRDGILDVVKDIGFKHVIVDTAALAPGNSTGAAIVSLAVVKEEFGLPAGCAIHNVVERSKWLDSFESDIRPTVDIASNLNVPVFGGDFVLFGPMTHAQRVFPAVAWEDILVSEYAEDYFGVEPCDNHPRRVLG